MFPLQLLALLFIAPPQHEGRSKEEEKEEEKKEEKCELRRGDLLEVPRTLFTHFGIYLGGGRVSHFIPDLLPAVSRDQTRIRRMVTNTRLVLGVLAKRGSVRVDSLEDFAYGAKILVNTLDQVCSRPALEAESVAKRAELLQGHVTYSLLWYNCEHYVMFCRYGNVTSYQTFQFCKMVRKLLLSRRVAKATAVMGAGLLLHLGAVTSCSALMVFLFAFIIWMAA